ncbi:c-type cytochrome [Aquabacterium sp.]|uniref:c-type cytochrome n=1 Tax=Aquabacterium sp. TaxID=1872578 RepID=UPI003D6CAD1F
MKLLPTLLTSTALALAALPVLANQELAQKKACMACHGIDKKIVGPAYQDVAKKYKGQKDAEAKLVQKVLKGGGGVWGTMAMPANPQVSEAEAKQLVKWILATK